MPFDPHVNFAYSTVLTAPSPATSGTSLVVQSGDGAAFGTAFSFNATVWPAGVAPTKANSEIVRVTAISTDTFTITRQQEGTSARTIVVGDQIAATVTAKTLTDVEQAVIAGFSGDGNDGNVTITTTVTLTKNMYYDTLTVNSPGILNTAGFIVHCKTALVVGTGGIIQRNGNNAAGSTGGAVIANAGALGGSSTTAGVTGTTTTPSNPANVNYCYGAAGGSGGNGTPNSGTSGASGNSFFTVDARSLPTTALGWFIESAGVRTILGGAPGGAGGGDGTNTGGGGGGGGGVLIINARSVTNNGTISANGGNGGNPAAGNTGGGGGGGGGAVFINCASYTGNAATATGGNGGTKQGTGANGSNGSAGRVESNVWT